MSKSEARQAWKDADEGMLTWCQDCGDDQPLRMCERCCEEYCYDCFAGEDHVFYCYSDDEDYF